MNPEDTKFITWILVANDKQVKIYTRGMRGRHPAFIIHRQNRIWCRSPK